MSLLPWVRGMAHFFSILKNVRNFEESSGAPDFSIVTAGVLTVGEDAPDLSVEDGRDVAELDGSGARLDEDEAMADFEESDMPGGSTQSGTPNCQSV